MNFRQLVKRNINNNLFGFARFYSDTRELFFLVQKYV